MLPPQSKILIIQTAFLGDVILATALVEKIAQHYPDASIHFLLRAGNEAVLQNNPHISRVWIWEKRVQKYPNLIRLIGNIRNQHFDWVINVNRFSAAGLITLLSGSRLRSGFDKNPFSLFFTHRVKHKYGLHETERNQQLVAVFTDEKSAMPRIYPAEKQKERVREFQNVPYVCLAPASVWFTKQWPAEKWIELMQALPESFSIYLLGSNSDHELCEQILKKSAKASARNLAGYLNIGESAALMAGARMNFVNDSAPMHIASAVNAPTTAIYCSTIPQFGFGPLADDSTIVQTKEKLDCRPCGVHGKKECPENHFLCAQSIAIEQLNLANLAAS